MKEIKGLILVLLAGAFILSCCKDDDNETVTTKSYSEVYATDALTIEDYLKTHYASVDADFNVVIEKIPTGGTQTPIFNMTQLKSKTVNLHDVAGGYKVYYLELRKGNGIAASKLDSTYVAYKGNYLSYDSKTTNGITTKELKQSQFDFAANPVWFKVDELVSGWGEIIPEFNSGTFTDNGNGTITYNDFGAGVMFLPSGLGYFGNSATGIPSYSPLVFAFKVMHNRQRDHDGDKIPSKFEYGNLNSTNPLDTDKDGLPDYLDFDDDNDTFLTKTEIRLPNGTYPNFADIPNCSGGSIKKHLDPSCK